MILDVLDGGDGSPHIHAARGELRPTFTPAFRETIMGSGLKSYSYELSLSLVFLIGVTSPVPRMYANTHLSIHLFSYRRTNLIQDFKN